MAHHPGLEVDSLTYLCLLMLKMSDVSVGLSYFTGLCYFTVTKCYYWVKANSSHGIANYLIAREDGLVMQGLLLQVKGGCGCSNAPPHGETRP